MKRYLYAFFTISLFAGCGITKYETPKIDAPKATKSGVKYSLDDANLTQDAWWTKFNDEVLNQLVNDALKNNNQILAAKANIDVATSKLKSSELSWLPTLAASGSAFSGSTIGSAITPKSAFGKTISQAGQSQTTFSGYEGGFVPSYSVNILANLSKTEIAKASLEMQIATLNAVTLSVISQTVGSYFMLLGQQNQLKLQKEIVADLEKLKALEIIRSQNGKGDMQLLARLDAQILDAIAVLPQIKKAISQTQNAIMVLLGKNPDILLTSADINGLSTKNIVPPNIPSSVLKNRPDIIMAEAKLKTAYANLNLANSVFFPTISLTGILGGASMALSNLFTLGTGFWALQAAASMPILNDSSFEDIKTAENGKYVAYYEYMQSVKAAFANVDDALNNYEQNVLSCNNHLNSVYASQKAYKIALSKYEAGAKDYRYAINQKLELDNEMINLNFAKMAELDAVVGVYQALAGGYNIK
ncbi:MAG: hypothetical protein RL154_999 [Pseudomonadota bacterium]|jgi:NodT family efflux transporter outer membrane factor (OMF) lipoprotein